MFGEARTTSRTFYCFCPDIVGGFTSGTFERLIRYFHHLPVGVKKHVRRLEIRTEGSARFATVFQLLIWDLSHIGNDELIGMCVGK